GERSIERHLEGFRALGAEISSTTQGLELVAKEGLHGASYTFPKKSHTGTEALLIAAVLASGKTTLINTGLEPEIDDLITFLNSMGAKIKRVGETIQIEGVPKLHGATHRVMTDRNEAVSYACMAIASKGDIIVENADSAHLKTFLAKLDEVGGRYEISAYGIRFWYDKPLSSASIITAPEPGFMTDWQPLWTTMMTQATGTSEVIEAVHNNRLAFVTQLNQMGAKIELFDPDLESVQSEYQFAWPEKTHNYHAARITGPTPLVGANLTVPDLRGGATLVMAAIIAQGESVISNIEHIDRGYENFDERLRNLSARIERVNH
ncbi:MAG: UDP-N-acetylglucosamine 1-carboxyvinyltransferase, partial [bacterium]